jgi:hypothetical protein
MESILSLTKAANSIRNDSFSSLKIEGDRLILINKKKEETVILISELHKIYITKHQFSFIIKMGIALIPLVLTFIFNNNFPLETALFVFFLLFIPLFVGLNNYRWYQLQLLLNDGVVFKKVFFTRTKQEQINVIHSVKKEMYNNFIKSKF